MQYSLNYFGTRFLSSENKITHFPGGFRLNQNETRFQLQRSLTKKFKYFVALPSPNTKKNHPKWDLGKDFSSQTFIERKKIQRFHENVAVQMDWRLRDVNVGLRGGKTFCAIVCASFIAGSRRAFLFVDCVFFLCRSVRVLTETEWNTRGANVFSL